MKKYIILLIWVYTIPLITYSQIDTRIQQNLIKHLNDTIDQSQFTTIISQSDTLYTFTSEVIKLTDEKTIVPKVQNQLSTKSISLSDLSFIPTTFSIDTQKDVGEIDIMQSTDEKGNMIYSVPIYDYNNSNVNSPGVQLLYNSSSNSSIAGKGWQIAGISAISITNKTIYHDGNVSAGKRNTESAFCLDGNRLIKTGTSGSNIIYESEFGKIKVTAIISNGQIKYFKAQNPDGSEAIYGFTSNILTKDCYPLTEITDALGNYVSYTYQQIENIYYITEIGYGGIKKASINHFAKIKFTYETKSDVDIIYTDGVKGILDRRIKEITTHLSNQILRTYRFTYEFKNVSLLKKIECISNSRSLNPLIFYYGKNNQAVSFESADNLLVKYFNKDKVPDVILQKAKFVPNRQYDALLAYPLRNNYTVIGYKTILGQITGYKYGSQYLPGDELAIYYEIGSGSVSPAVITAGDGFIQMIPLDIDGDGTDEIVKMNYNVINSGTERVTYTVYDVVYSLGQTALSQRAQFTADFDGVVESSGLFSPSAKTYLFGDFLGNGKQNVLSISYCKNFLDQNTTSKAILVDIAGKTKSSIYNKSCFNLDYDDYVFAFDFDGDGKTDICHVGKDGTNIYTFNTSGSLVKIGSSTGINRTSFTKKKFLIGDINGDGKADIAISPTENDFTIEYYTRVCGCSKCRGIVSDLPSKCVKDILYQRKVYRPTAYRWRIALSTGTTFDVITKDISLNEGTDFVLQDMNGDGKSDLLVHNHSLNSISLYLAKNGSINALPESQKSRAPAHSKVIAANTHNGAEMAHLFCLYQSNLCTIKYKFDQSEEQLLTGLVTSHGVIHKNSYSNTKDPNNYNYERGNECTYPFMNTGYKIHLYTGTDTYVNNNLKSSLSYSYKRGVANLEGRGFLGFETVKFTDRLKDVAVTNTYDVLSYGELKKTDSPKETISYTYTYDIPQSRISKILISKKSHLNKLRNLTVSTSYKYDSYGHMTQEFISYGNNTATITDFLYNNYTSSTYRLGVLYQKTKQKTKLNYTGYYEKEYVSSFTTDGTYLPKIVNYYLNNVQVKDVINTYEENTNRLIKEDWRDYESPYRQATQYQYDSFGRLTKKTDPLNLYQTYGYNLKGELISESNQLSKSTSHDYDNWGRLIKSTYPTGEIVTANFKWSSALTDVLYQTETSSNAKPTRQIYYDALGRELRKGEKRFDGKYLYTDIKYNTKGNTEKISLPFTGSSPVSWTNYEYDNHDRLKIITYPTQRKDTYTYYSDNTVSVINGVKKTYKYDSEDQVISIIEDLAGTTTYALRPDGKPSSVNSLGVTTSFEYDNSGRRTAIVDPSAGRQTFTYDTRGNLVAETLANGNEVKMIYDKYNRVIVREFVKDQTLTYSYNENNFLISEVSTNGASTYYTPDDLLRVKTIKETGVDNTWLQKDYGYGYGNISSIVYTANTGNITTETYKYQNGVLTQIMAGGTSIWQLIKENTMGQQAEVASNNLQRTYTYDSYGMPATQKIKNSGNTIIQDYSYSFDSKSRNLLSRKDNKRNLQENFTYDGLDRLTAFSGKNITYDNKGNITNISNIGSMLYKSESPYAIEYLTPTSNEYKQRSQAITYNAMQRPSSIVEDGYNALLTYNGKGERVRMAVIKDNVNQLTRYYLGNCYEKDTGVGGTKEKLYLAGDAYSAPAVMVKQGTGAWAIHYIGRDYLGNITQVTNSSGVLVQELSYDPYGRLRNPDNHTLYAIGSEPALFLGRGFTGHEHLHWFGLINMNARLYDVCLYRFLSPDPYVQEIFNSQSYNRYTYCLNNPLMYTDNSGELFGFGWISGIFGGFIKGIGKFFRTGDILKIPTYSWKGLANAVKIDYGLYKGDGSQILSRFTYEIPQTLIGNVFSHYRNTMGNVDKVRYFDGATYVINANSKKYNGVTIGGYINMNIQKPYEKSIYEPEGTFVPFGDVMFMHEYGHYLQSQKMGWLYLFKVGIPSLISASKEEKGKYYGYYNNGWGNVDLKKHDLRNFEMDANKRAAEYFYDKYGVVWNGYDYRKFPTQYPNNFIKY